MVTESEKQLFRTNIARDINSDIEYAVNQPKDPSRRKFLYVAAGVAAVGAYTAADAYFGWTPWGRLVRSLFTGPRPPVQGNYTTTTTITSPTSPTLSPLASYAKDKGLSKSVIAVLDVKLGGEATDNNKSFVNYLYGVSQADVVSPEVLQFAPEEYKPSVIESLQFKAIGDVIKENKVSDQAVKSLGYLSGFPGAVQRNTIEFGLDDTTLEFLGLTAALPDQDSAKYFVEWGVPIQDHKLTDLKRKFLQEPGNYAKDLFGEYIAEMMSAGNLYVDLAREWENLPESKKIDLAAVDSTGDFSDLFLNATNPEVKEAGELMLKGGTPDPRDFKYNVPKFNTELQVLNWLGRQNWFKKDDTLTQAIAMDNGIWVTMGDDEVRAAVYRDTNDLLNFLRGSNEIQGARGYSQLEDYPLEAKITLGWTGGESPDVAKSHALSLFLNKELDMKSYKWDFTSVDTLEKMRTFMINEGLLGPAFETLKKVSYYFMYDGPHWTYTLHGGQTETVDIDGEFMGNYMFGSTNHCFDQFLKKGKVYGVSYDHLPFIDALLQSVGIPSTHIWLTSSHKPPGQAINDFNIVYVPENGVWRADPEQIRNVAWMGDKLVYGALNEAHLILFKPPVVQQDYLTGIADGRKKFSYYCTDVNFCDMLYPEYSAAYTSILNSSYDKGIAFDEMKKMVADGIASSQMKQWLLYSKPTSRVF